MARWSFTALQQVLRRVEATFHVSSGLECSGADRRLGVVGVSGAIEAVWHRAFPPGAELGTAVLGPSGRQMGAFIG